MDKFRNKYRIQSHRKPNWDYSADALYFLTIVTQHRVCNLGNIVAAGTHDMAAGTHDMAAETHGRASLPRYSDFGKIVNNEWLKSFEIRNELILHEYVIMPNHIHAIVEIYHAPTHGMAPTHGIAPARGIGDDLQSEIELLLSINRNVPFRLPKSISSFLAGFKSAVNTNIDNFIDEHQLSTPKYNRNNHFFQPNYHDHIIRDQIEYQNIRNYIINNPRKWHSDIFNDYQDLTTRTNIRRTNG